MEVLVSFSTREIARSIDMIFVPSLPKSWLLQAAKCRLVGMISLSRHQSLARLKPRKRSSWLDYCGDLGLHVSFRIWRILASTVRGFGEWIWSTWTFYKAGWKMSTVVSGDEVAPFVGFIGAAAALIFSCMSCSQTLCCCTVMFFISSALNDLLVCTNNAAVA